MATQASSASPEVIRKAFVEQYYHILHEAPDQVHKFYQDTSTIGWAGSDGVMEYVASQAEISRKIMSMDFSKYLISIENADAVLSLNGSALIVVTGSFTLTSDDVCQKFTQTFFLAPQKSGGYFVLNDILRLLPERNQKDATTAVAEERITTDHVVVENTVNDTTVKNNPTVNGITVESNVSVEPPVKVTKEDAKKTPVAASPPPAQKDIPKKHPISAPPPPAQKDAIKKTPVAASPPPAQKDIPKKHPISAPPPPAQKDAIKKTYASIVKDNKAGPPPVKPKIAKPVSKPPTKVVDESAKPFQAAETTPASTSVTKSSTSNDEQGYSIFVRGLPSGSTVKMVGEEFKKFGAIKPGGIQVRNSKFDESCFGFVEFESQQSMQAAIEASPVFIAENKITIEQKRTSTRVVNGVVTNAGGGGRFPYGPHNFRGQGGGYGNNANYRGGDHFNRREDGDHFNRREDGGNHFNRREDGGNHYNRRNDDGNNRRNDDGNFNAHRNEFSGRGRGAPQGNGYHQKGNGFYQPRPFQTPVNGPKQTPAAA